MTARPPLVVSSAPLSRRAGAYAIDVLVAYGIGTAGASVAYGVALGLGLARDARTLPLAVLAAALGAGIGLLSWAFAYTAMQGGRGSVGQRALGLRLLDAQAPVAIGFWRALWRNVVWAASCAIVVGWFTPLFDASPRRQGWHDRAATALVLDVREADAAARVAAPSVVASAPRPAPVASAKPQPWFLDEPAPAPAPSRAASADALAPALSPAVRPVLVASPASAMARAASSASVAEASAPPALIPQAPATRPVTLPGLDETREATVPPPAQRAALFDDAPVVAVLTWDDGTRMAVYGRTLYGRNPEERPGIVSVPVRDETLSLSKTHFEIGGDARGAWVADRHSTNGTVIVRDGGRHPLVAGVEVTLRAGDHLELGDRIATVSVPR